MNQRATKKHFPAIPFVRSVSSPASTLPPTSPPPAPPSHQLFKKSSLPINNGTQWQREEEVYQELVGLKGRRQLLFAEIVEKHAHELPMMVELGRSLYGLCEDLTLTVGQNISIHFLKKTEIARVTGKRGNVLSVPINTSLRFSPLYEDVKEYNYGSVKKLVCAKPPPLVVCVSEASNPDSSNSAATVLSGDVLILKDGKRRSFRTGHTCWFNTRTNQDIRLSERGSMRFTSMSERTKLSVPVLLKHISLPQRCFVYAGDDATAAERRLVRRCFQDGMCTILCHQVETSLVASCKVAEFGNPRVLEIVTDFGIPVHIVNISGPVQQNLIKKSCDLFQSFRPEMINTFICGDMDPVHANLDLRRSVGDSNKMMGITLVHPECLKPPASTHHDYDHLVPCYYSKRKVDKTLDSRSDGIHTLQKSIQNSKLSTPNKPVTPFDKSSEEIQFQMNECYRAVNIMASEPNSQEINRTFLSKLGCRQVLQLLDNMNLGMYKPVFERERITGDLLLGFDDSILEKELGIRSRIHRLKFIKLITGQYSAEKFLLQSNA